LGDFFLFFAQPPLLYYYTKMIKCRFKQSLNSLQV
jgi:hypothetical protein